MRDAEGFQLCGIVRDEQRGAASDAPPGICDHGCFGDGIEPFEGFVQEQQVVVYQKRAQDGDTAPHAAGEFTGRLPIRPGKADEIERMRHFLHAARRIHEADVAHCAEVVAKPILLKDNAQPRIFKAGDRASIRPFKSHEQTQQRGLSCAGRGHETGDAASRECRRKILQHRPALIRFAKIFNDDVSHGSHPL